MRRLLILCAALGLLAAGCGGGGGGASTESKPLTKAEYQAKLQQTATEVANKLGDSSKDIDKMSSKDLDQLSAGLHEFADRIRAIHPPDEVKQLNADLASAMDDIGDEFPDIARRLKETKDPSAAIGILFGAKGFQELIKLGQEFKAKGYKLDLNGTSGS